MRWEDDYFLPGWCVSSWSVVACSCDASIFLLLMAFFFFSVPPPNSDPPVRVLILDEKRSKPLYLWIHTRYLQINFTIICSCWVMGAMYELHMQLYDIDHIRRLLVRASRTSGIRWCSLYPPSSSSSSSRPRPAGRSFRNHPHGAFALPYTLFLMT